MSRWKLAVIISSVALSVAFAVLSYYGVVRNTQERRQGSARSTLINCQGIEVVKTELRRTILDNLKQLPSIAYYETHPNELRDARLNSQTSLARFAALDCYALPAVKAAGLHP
jgi:hypothetical protein